MLKNKLSNLTVNGYIATALLLQVTVLLIRFAGWIIYRNYALLFESFHILTDIMVTVAVFAAIRLSKSNYSKKYSYGLFRVEDLVSLAIAVIIAATALDLLLSIPTYKTSFQLGSGLTQLASVIPLFLSGIIKIVGGKRVKAPSLVSDGYHNYSDVYVGTGVGLGLIATYATHLDAFYYVAVGIAAIGIFYTSVKIGRDSVIGIMDLPKDKSVIPKIEGIVKRDEQVTDVKSIKARWAGPVIFVEIVITVNSRLTIEEAHDVADSIERDVLSEIPGVRDVVIHIEPSRSLKRIVLLPVSEPGKIEKKTSKSLNYLIVTIIDGKRTDTRTIQIPSQEITLDKNAQRVLSIAKENLVTDAVLLDAGEVLSSMLTVNHIELWKANSKSVDENIQLFIDGKLNKLKFE
ncbi:MAG: cation diffusion facilitator family transporter [Thermoplasmata archaeon]